MKKTFDIANITFRDGTLVINTNRVSLEGKHYNVSIEETNNTLIVTGERPKISLNWKGDMEDEDLNLYTPDSIEEYRPWFSKTTKKRLREGWVETKKREIRQYTSNKYMIIE